MHKFEYLMIGRSYQFGTVLFMAFMAQLIVSISVTVWTKPHIWNWNLVDGRKDAASTKIL